MADWTNLPNTAVGVGGLPSGTTVTALRDNPVAIAEGAAGAPLISGAMRKIQDNQEIGAFIFARGPSTTAYGDVVAGSSLTYAGAISSASASATGSSGGPSLRVISFNAGASGSPSGSWVCLGRISTTASATPTFTGNDTASASATGATLWQRVS
jgi:hypothetical protein